MPLPVSYGDVPSWIAAGTGLAAFAQSFRTQRQQRVIETAIRIQEQSGLGDTDLAAAIEGNPFLGELFEDGFEAAMRSAAQEKRRLLANVLVAALAGEDARLDELQILLRTISAIEPYHLVLLVRIGIPRPGDGHWSGTRLEGSWHVDELRGTTANDQQDLLGPMLSTLAGEALVHDAALGTFGYGQPAWALSQYGRRLLAFLPGSGINVPDVNRAQVTMRYEEGDPPTLVVRNLGFGRATIAEVEIPRRHDGQPLILDPDVCPFSLEPGTERAFTVVARTPGFSPPYDVAVRWRDDGPDERTCRKRVEPRDG